MKVIKLSYPITQKLTASPVVLALGFFDGVHLGHQRLIGKAHEIAKQRNLPLMVLTFDRHPKEIYQHDENFKYLDSPDEKRYEMAALDVDYLVIAQFTTGFSHLPPQAFVDNVIVKLQAQIVVAGFDYTYGPKNVANMAHLADFARHRFEIVSLPEQTFNGHKIGSTKIRQALRQGQLEIATQMLGHPYLMSGTIVHGLRNGHRLGFPTMNLKSDIRKVVPKVGVYATKTKFDGQWYPSMTSVGYNVTIGQPSKIYIESHLFGFDQETYGQEMTIAWYHYLRGEIKFDRLEDLKKQMLDDQKQVEAYFAQDVAAQAKDSKKD